jgi:hypothetical protein
MESNQNSQKSNNLWIGELEQFMDEKYLRDACIQYSKININIFYHI